jgi:Zinc finger, C2H2 type
MEIQARFKCEVCASSFGLLQNFNLHMATIHEKRAFLCEKCGEMYSRKDHLHQHLESCLGGKKKRKAPDSGELFKWNYQHCALDEKKQCRKVMRKTK